MDDLAALSDKIFTRYTAAGERLDAALAAMQEFPDGANQAEFDRLMREEAKAHGAWHAWSEMHQLVIRQRVERANRKGGETQ